MAPAAGVLAAEGVAAAEEHEERHPARPHVLRPRVVVCGGAAFSVQDLGIYKPIYIYIKRSMFIVLGLGFTL